MLTKIHKKPTSQTQSNKVKKYPILVVRMSVGLLFWVFHQVL